MADEPKQDDLDSLEETWLTDDRAPENFNWQWRKVIQGLMSGLPIYQAYAEAYEIDTADEQQRRSAESNGSRLMRNDRFRKLWRRVIEERGFNDEYVDWRLTDIIQNSRTSERDRIAAIKHFNELRGRLVRRTDLTTDGKAIELPIIVSSIKPRNATTETETTSSP